MDIYKFVAIGIMATILSLTIKKENPTFSLIISIAASVLIFIMALPSLTSVLDILKDMASTISESIPYTGILLKIVGVAYIAELGAQICADAGETSISSKIEFAGKIIILTISSPIIFTLLQQVITLLP